MSKHKWSSLLFRLSRHRDSKSRSRQSLKMQHMKTLKDLENKLNLPWSTWKWTSKQIIKSSIIFFKVKTTVLLKSLVSRIRWRICNLCKTAHNYQDWLRWDNSNSAITTTDLSTNKTKIKFRQLRCRHNCNRWSQFLSNNWRAKALCRYRTCSRINSRLFQSWIKLQK